MLGNEVVGYQVEVNGLRHRDGTREVTQFNVARFDTEIRKATVNQGLGIKGTQQNSEKFYGSVYLFFTAGEVPYNITVKALNLAGCGEEQQLYCFTQEGGTNPLYLYHYKYSGT